MAHTPPEPAYPRLDAQALRVLAHPLRSRLLTELRMEGPATATTLAQALDTNTGATSYHLRKLESVGLVAETEGGHGRERVWRAAHEMHSWFASDTSGDPDSEAASAWLQGAGLRHFQEYAEHWLRTQLEWPDDWRDALGASDYLLTLSVEQLTAMLGELWAVIERYRTTEPGPDARRVLFYLHAFPDPRRGVR
jgi:DNA-binding transcriptional ArsR family regulator